MPVSRTSKCASARSVSFARLWRDPPRASPPSSTTAWAIPADKLEELYEPFSQADTSTTRRYGGTGLGLAICKQLTELLGGRIWMESTLGEGTAAHFTVRAEVAAA